jgi:M6 family metalloprotease-like protein
MKISTFIGLFAQGLVLFLLASLVAPLSAQKLTLRRLPENTEAKKHPYTYMLRKPEDENQKSRAGGDYEKLLVILVDFQEDNDPLSTGNGKFQLEPDPNYIYSIAAPPHNREYFEANLEAMRYYYKAVSAGSYNLNYDVWPKDKPAYTLSQAMSYYNPPNVSSYEFVSKMEEYFKEAFETADRDDPQINFGDYAHYMIIHAGSDWQHDVLGDSPVDIPSFFIRVGEGKQAIVDDGTVEIYHASNVPATISQDFRTQEVDGVTIHSGYGALNSVLFHEFGHSLGLVDLYNVQNFRPMVGAFDIMDSGGAGILVDELENEDLVYVEGILPALPGAFSRALLFEDSFRARGLMKDITDFEPFTAIKLAASSLMQGNNLKPTIVKFPINPDEYYLIENRSVDPDNDGDTAVFGALNGRVVLHPTANGDPNNNPTYEYDYLLPSFVHANGTVRGGGIMVWRVNDKVLYQEGRILDDGSLWTNFQNNSVNTNFRRPGVMVLEADGIRDLGEYYSWYWTGTPYEYFHARKPFFNKDGKFVQWSNHAWRPRLSALTSPAMLDENGLGSLYYLDQISDPAPVMSFVLKAGLFENTFYSDIAGSRYAGEPINTPFSDFSIPHIGSGRLRLISNLFDDWLEMVEPAALDVWDFDYPSLSVDFNHDGYSEIIGIKGSIMRVLDFTSGELATACLSFPDNLGKAMAFDNAVYTYSPSILYRVKNHEIDAFADLSGIKNISAFDSKVIALTANSAVFFDALTLVSDSSLDLPEVFGDYEPVICKDNAVVEIFFTANSGNIYRYTYPTAKSAAGALSLIFRNSSEYLPSQPALLAVPGEALRIFFGLGNRAYLLSYNGFLENGFPHYLDKVSINPKADSRALKLEGEYILYLPVASQGYVAISDQGEPRPQYSLLLPPHQATNNPAWSDIMRYDEANQRLVWYYTIVGADEQRSYIHTLDASENPLLWNAYLNSGSGMVLGTVHQTPGTTPVALDAFVFPNPVNKGSFRLRVMNAPANTVVDIYDITGIKVQTHTKNEMNFDLELESRSLSSGVYLVRVSSGKQSKNFKFAVEK